MSSPRDAADGRVRRFSGSDGAVRVLEWRTASALSPDGDQCSMSLYRLDRFFAPRSVAIVGATDRPHSMGQALMANMAAAGFSGTLYPINPKHRVVGGVKAHARLADLPAPPDLAVIATPARRCRCRDWSRRRRGSASLRPSSSRRWSATAMSRRAAVWPAPCATRASCASSGPTASASSRPMAGVDASFSSRKTRPGSLALISQSGAIAAALLEWAEVRHIGFSGGRHPRRPARRRYRRLPRLFRRRLPDRAILVYIEAIKDVRKFMASARAAARSKTLIVLKSGRSSAAPARREVPYGALARARTMSMPPPSRAPASCASPTSTNSSPPPRRCRAIPSFAGDRLGIVTNGGGLGVLAVDALMDHGGRLAASARRPVAGSTRCCRPPGPVAIPSTSSATRTPPRYAAAMEAALDDREVDAVRGHELPDGAAPEPRCGEGRGERRHRPEDPRRAPESRSSRSGSATRRRRPTSSPRPACRATRPNPRRCAHLLAHAHGAYGARPGRVMETRRTPRSWRPTISRR